MADNLERNNDLQDNLPIEIWQTLQRSCDFDLLIFSKEGLLLYKNILHKEHESYLENLIEENKLSDQTAFQNILSGRLLKYQEECSIGKDLIIQIKGELLKLNPSSSAESVYLVLTISDITDSRKMELIVKDNERRLRSFLDASPDIFIIADMNGRIKNIHYNQLHGKLILGKMLGKKVQDSFELSISDNDWEKTLAASHEGRKIQKINARWVKNDNISHFVVSVVPGTGNDAVILMRDNSEIYMKEEQIQILEKNSSMVEIASGMSKELTKNLQSIVSYINNIEISELPGSMVPYINKAKEAAQDAEEILNHLFSFSTVNKEDLTHFDLVDAVDEAISFCRYGLSGSIVLSRSASTPLPFFGPYRQLVGIFINLIMNAREAMDQKGIINIKFDKKELKRKDREIISGIWNPGIFYEIIIEDNGYGISKEMLSKIFHPLFSLKKKKNSTGMGLTILKGIIDQLKGGIRVESQINIGTVFHLYFPITDTLDYSNPYSAIEKSISSIDSDFDDLDKDFAIALLEGNEKLYRTISRDFVLDYKNTPESIIQNIEEEEWEKAQIQVHSIKGLAGLIGSKELQENARYLEDILKSNDQENIDLAVNLFNANLISVIKQLNLYLEEGEKEKDSFHSDMASLIFPELEKNHIEELKKLKAHLGFSEYNESMELLEVFRKYSWGKNWNNTVVILEDLVSRFMFDDAMVWLNNYIS